MTTAAKLIAHSSGAKLRAIAGAASTIEDALDELLESPFTRDDDARDLAMTVAAFMVVSTAGDLADASALLVRRAEQFAAMLERIGLTEIELRDAVAEVM